MHAKNRSYRLTVDLLKAYGDAALVNACALLDEAELLLAHEHYARAYFLSASSIEEAGKAVQAFEGMGRNLSDSAVAYRLKLQFEDHSQKMTSAFSPWVQATPNIRDEIMDFVRTMVDLKFGREAAMYTDVRAETAAVTTPQMQVCAKAAKNCVRLAGTVLIHVRQYVEQSQPRTATRVQDEFFALKPALFQRMANAADFWEYYLSQMEQGSMTLEAASTEYHKRYLSQGKLFKSAPRDEENPDALL